MKTVRWVLAHEPIELFLRAANRFKETIEQTAPGELNLEILTLSEYSAKYNNGEAVSKHDLLGLMSEGKIEVSQMYTSTLGRKHNRDMWALDLPFLFKDHDHATRVFEGPIGDQLLDGLGDSRLGEKGGVHGLAFTYSGGFRNIPANVKIEKIEDFAGVKLRCNKSPIAQETIEAVGGVSVPIELEQINEGVQSGEIVGGESTYPRFYGLKQNEVMNQINDTQHSLFLTTILTSNSFWNDLDPELQKKVQAASFDAAKAERVWSVEDIDLVQSQCADEGIEVNIMSEAERSRFQEKTAYIYDKFADEFSEGLVDSIKNA